MDLNRFCANSIDPRAYLSTPFRDGDNVIATNGHIMVVVPGMAGDFPVAASNMAGMPARFNAATRSGVLTPLSSITLPDRVPCPVCGGKGHGHEVRCDECDGEGEFKHGSHWYECKECGGDCTKPCHESTPGAVKHACYRCNGFGEAFGRVTVADALFQRCYMALLATLPDCHIETAGPEGTAKFTFDGGYGFLMPCRP